MIKYHKVIKDAKNYLTNAILQYIR